ncbi:hypothetical protein C8R47DRAFT_407190 [Mycena vitilis]|nr:hypothetical protein C8R47DRAFT_407190 [Mycena vitilis]
MPPDLPLIRWPRLRTFVAAEHLPTPYISIPVLTAQMPALRELSVLFSADMSREVGDGPPFTFGVPDGRLLTDACSRLTSVTLANSQPTGPIFKQLPATLEALHLVVARDLYIHTYLCTNRDSGDPFNSGDSADDTRAHLPSHGAFGVEPYTGRLLATAALISVVKCRNPTYLFNTRFRSRISGDVPQSTLAPLCSQALVLKWQYWDAKQDSRKNFKAQTQWATVGRLRAKHKATLWRRVGALTNATLDFPKRILRTTPQFPLLAFAKHDRMQIVASLCCFDRRDEYIRRASWRPGSLNFFSNYPLLL